MFDLSLLTKLLQAQSITPNDDGAISILADHLKKMGFICHLVEFGDQDISDFSGKNSSNQFDDYDIQKVKIKNLYARFGTKGKNLCFAGHTDVVPTGPLALWKHDPFAGVVDSGVIYGRGVVDMKGAIAAFVAAVEKFLNYQNNNETNINNFEHSLSFLITGDEEGVGINGTAKMLEWLQKKGEVIDACIVGEPVSEQQIGDTVKVGARGSATFALEVVGKQGHVAYHHLANNPATTLAKILHLLKMHELDQGNQDFIPSNMEITMINSDSGAENVIPMLAKAMFNIRYGDMHTADSLYHKFSELIQESHHNLDYTLKYWSSGNAFISRNNTELRKIVGNAIVAVTGKMPSFNCSGGTSDARFIYQYCPVLEIGMLSNTAHKVNENAEIQDLKTLSAIYALILQNFFF